MKFLEPKSMHNNSDQVESTRKVAMCGGMNVDGDDRLSTLPDDLIHKILSFVSIQEAIETSFLSSRWRSIWTSIPYLNFAKDKFFPLHRFSKLVLNVLSRRNDQVQVSSVNLIDRTVVSYNLVKRIVKYAFSHNVQQLTVVTCDLKVIKFPLSVFSSKSLKHLTFGLDYYTSTCNVSPTWELPALTTLHLDYVTLSDEHHTTTDSCIGLFSKCPNLNNLSLRRCKIEGTNVFNIFHPTLSNLTLEDTFWTVEVINVVTPQLKNLTIRYCYGEHMISAPELTSLVFKGYYPLQISTEGFPFLEKVDLIIVMPTLVLDHKIVCLLQQLHTVRFLTLNFNFLKLLCSSTELTSHQPCAFPNLKISKFSTNYTRMVYLEVATQEEVSMITELENHDTSPTAIFTLVSCEEIEAMSKLVLARELIEELRVLLKMRGRNSDHITGCKRKRGKVQVMHWVQSAFEMQWNFGEMMTQIEQGMLDGLVTKEKPALKTRHMISMLQCIEGLITELPASKRPALQVTFSSICEEAAVLMNNMIYRYAEARDSVVTSFKETETESRSLIYL